MKLGKTLKTIDEVIAKGPFAANWESLKAYRVPQWYQDGKFGIFIHWGVYAVPAFANEWYPRHMYIKDQPEYKHHLETYGPHTEFGYKDFIPMFKAEKFDPQAWAELFKQAGARFVMPVAEHHDGFAMYDSDVSDWTAAKMGPKRDLIGDLAQAVRAQGMVFSVSSHITRGSPNIWEKLSKCALSAFLLSLETDTSQQPALE
jgi:alpha-L-fucosidase